MAGYIGSKGSGIISGIGASIADLNLTDKASANGTTEANKVLTADGNKDVTAIRNLTATGNLAATGDATVGGSITATGAVTRALTRGSIDVGNSSGVSSALAKGASGTVLTSDGTDLSFAAVVSGYVAPTLPDWANPDNTYTSSGTWSKGGLADDAVVWIYMVGGGSGGWSSPDSRTNGSGGFCRIIVGTAADFNGGAYVIGAGGTAGANGGNPGLGGNGGNTTFTNAAGNRAWTAYGGNGTQDAETQASNTSSTYYGYPGGEQVFAGNIGSYISLVGSGSALTGKSGVSNVFNNLISGSVNSVQTSVFNGGTRPTLNDLNTAYARTSLFGGNAGVSQYLPSGGTTTSTTAGSVPGGMGGCARVANSNFSGAQPKAGGAGNVRVYHV